MYDPPYAQVIVWVGLALAASAVPAFRGDSKAGTGGLHLGPATGPPRPARRRRLLVVPPWGPAGPGDGHAQRFPESGWHPAQARDATLRRLRGLLPRGRAPAAPHGSRCQPQTGWLATPPAACRCRRAEGGGRATRAAAEASPGLRTESIAGPPQPPSREWGPASRPTRPTIRSHEISSRTKPPRRRR